MALRPVETYANPFYYYNPADTPAANPPSMRWFGVDGVSVDLHLTAPSGKDLTVPAFYLQDYVRLKDGGLGVEVLGRVDDGAWAARFEAAEVGTYQYFLTAQDKDGAGRYPASGSLSFDVTASSNKGFIRPSTVNPRFLAYSNGSSFVPVGAGRQWWANNALRSYDYETAFATFKANGVDLTRMWNQVDFGLSIEGTSQPVWLSQGTVYGAAQGVEVSTANVHAGLRSARPATGQGWFQRLAVKEPTRVHKLIVWVKTTSLSGGQAQVTVTAGNTSTEGGMGQISPISGTTAWTAYYATLTPNTSLVSLNIFQSGTAGAVYVDDVAFGPVDGSGTLSTTLSPTPISNVTSSRTTRATTRTPIRRCLVPSARS